jgi:AcrR family transcriptional regulator
MGVGRANIAAMRRRQIVDAAIAVMARRGWTETSIDEITREAGVSRGLVSYHFKDKAELLSGVLARCEEASAETLAAAIASSDHIVDQLRIGVRVALAMVRDDPAIYEIFLHFAASARGVPELGAQIRDLYRGFRGITADTIRAGQAQGHFRTDIDADAAAARHIGTLTGFALQWLLDAGSFPFEEAARQTEDMLIGYLTAGPKAAGRTAAAASAQPAAS